MRLLKIVAPAFAVSLLAAPLFSQTPAPGAAAGSGDTPSTARTPAQGKPRAGEAGGRPASRTGEKSQAAWEVEAKGVARQLGLGSDLEAKLVKAYTDSRKSHRAAYDKARAELPVQAETPAASGSGASGGETDKRPPRRGRPNAGDLRKATDAVRAAEAEKLSVALAAFLSPEQVTLAMEPMGTFDTNWDDMTNSLATLKLDPAKAHEAQTSIAAFVVAYAKARQGTDRQAARTATDAAKAELLEALNKSMTDEQIVTFQKSAGPLFRTAGEPNAPEVPTRAPRSGSGGSPPAGDKPPQAPGTGG